MSGSVALPSVIPVPRIRAEARWLGLQHDAFDDFVTILMQIDDEFVAVNRARELQEASARARQNTNKKNRR